MLHILGIFFWLTNYLIRQQPSNWSCDECLMKLMITCHYNILIIVSFAIVVSCCFFAVWTSFSSFGRHCDLRVVESHFRFRFGHSHLSVGHVSECRGLSKVFCLRYNFGSTLSMFLVYISNITWENSCFYISINSASGAPMSENMYDSRMFQMKYC